MSSKSSGRVLNTIAKRAEIIECILDGIDDKREIEDRLDVSRATVNRALRELEDADLIEVLGTDFEPTLFGVLSFEAFSRFRERSERLDDLRELLRLLPSDSQIDLRVVEGADSFRVDPRAPQETFRRVKESIKTANEVQAIISVITPLHVELLEQMVDSEIRAELLIDNALIELLSTNYPDTFEAISRSTDVTFHETDNIPSFEVVIVNSELLWIDIYSPDGAFRGLIRNTSEEAIEWAVETIKEYHSQSSISQLKCPN